jgi:integrase
MTRHRKVWSQVVEQSGIAVRVYERAPGGLLYREVRQGGQKDRKSLGHHDRKLAVSQARECAQALGEQMHAGTVGRVTFGTVVQLYIAHRVPQLSATRQARLPSYLGMLRRGFGDGLRLDDLDQTRIDGYVAARRTGAIDALAGNYRGHPARDGTIRLELSILNAILRWALGFRINGKRLLIAHPLDGLTLPRERNIRRPIASEERYRRTLAKADTVDPTGRLACLLALARYTGRRINAICQLRASDLLLSPATVERTLAATGRDVRESAYMPHGAILWRREHDKLGYEELTPLAASARTALDVYVRQAAIVGDAPLFPNSAHHAVAMDKNMAQYFLRRAELQAGLAKLDQGAWHPYRRLWASERKHLSDVDVARAGGWRNTAVMKQAYQQADPQTVLSVVENTPSGHTLDTAASQVQAGQGIYPSTIER